MENLDNHNMLHRMSYADKEILLLGTAHVSKESAVLVKEVIEKEKPDTVCVELCPSRYQSIRQKNAWQEMDIVKVIREKKVYLLITNLLLSSFQKRIAKKLDIKPGEEMLQAIESAERNDSEIYLADRDIRVTMSRTWRLIGFTDKLKLLFQILLSVGDVEEITEEDVENMKQQDVLETLLSEVEKSLPGIRSILIDERDRYLAHKIRTAPGQKIVAVVGAGHVPGIKKYWDKEIDVEALETIPPKKKIMGLLKWLIPAAVCLLFALGFFYGGKDTGKEMLIWWIMANGVLAGSGAILALAHPLTIISSFLAAPLTSLNPMIAAGWVSGLVEAFFRKPKVIDFENLQEDIQSVKGFWANNVTRILLVVVFTNLGSVVGTFVATPFIIKMLVN